MKRMKVLFGNRRMMVMLTLAILVLAAAAIIASSASFTASANVSNTFTAGSLQLSSGGVVFNNPLWPGHSIDGTSGVTVTANGGQAGLWFRVDSVQNPSVAALLTVQVFDASGTTPLTPAYAVTDPLIQDGVHVASGLGNGDTPSYVIRVNFPDGDAGDTALSDFGADNPYQGATGNIVFQWVAVSE
jgi:predicted ribosomally synthesized peptide with SipW-like signal peptide